MSYPEATGRDEAEEDVWTARRSANALGDKVYVAVKREFGRSDCTLLWALRNVVEKKVVLVHMRRPSTFRDYLGDHHEHLKAHRRLDEEEMLDKYVLMCKDTKVQAEKLILETTDVAKCLIEIISLYGVTKFVMGATADRHYSKSMKVLKSKTARTVQKQAPSWCKIWFVCGSDLVLTREAGQNSNGTSLSFMATPVSTAVGYEQMPPRSPRLTMPPRSPRVTSLTKPSSNPVLRLFKFISNPTSSPKHDSPDSQDSCEKFLEPVNVFPRTSHTSCPSPSGIIDETSKSGSALIVKNDESEDCLSISQQEVLESDDGLFRKLQEIIVEVEKLKCDNLQEAKKRHKAEREMVEAQQKIKIMEVTMTKERKVREGADEALKRKNLDYEEIKSLQDETSKELKITNVQKKALEAQLLESSSTVMKLEEKLLQTQDLLSTLKHDLGVVQDEKVQMSKKLNETITQLREKVKLEAEHRSQLDKIQKEHQAMFDKNRILEAQLAAYNTSATDLGLKLMAAQEALTSLESERDELKGKLEQVFREMQVHTSRVGEPNGKSAKLEFAEFSCLEIEQATQNFDSSMKIGEGGYGSVYKGVLHNTTVAIKIINPLSLQSSSEFLDKVEVLCKVRHPNVVNFLGACLERKALIYEYLPNGSLEDRLICKNGSPPLPWQVRARICFETCSALIFLHSSQPQCVVHGDLKTENILLDANFVSKLSDFGMRDLLVPPTATSVVHHHIDPKGSFVYMDPELLSTGALAPQSDVYALGILILRLLTGKHPMGIIKLVQEAQKSRKLKEILDPTAGDWPFVQAQQLAYLGLRCCETSRARRPDLVKEVLTVVKPMTRALSGPSPLCFGLTEDNSVVPSYFICPIFQEVMRDPQIAADGFTYEAEALRGWLEAGHDTSPMTNVKLPTKDLIPNHALRSAIQEWLQQRRRS